MEIGIGISGQAVKAISNIVEIQAAGSPTVNVLLVERDIYALEMEAWPPIARMGSGGE